jgi:hypothetical protein
VNNELSKLKIETGLSPFKKLTLIGEQNILKLVLLKFFSLKLSNRILSKINFYINLFLTYNQELEKNKQFARKYNEKFLDSNEFGYTGDYFINEINFMKKYKTQIDDKNFIKSESSFVYNEILLNSKTVLDASKESFYVNFGIGYAYTDAILAEQYTTSLFVGVERTEAAEIFNKHYLTKLPKNLKFMQGSLLEMGEELRATYLSETMNLKSKVLVTARTMCLLPEHLVRDIYAFAKSLQFEYIIGVEQFGIPRKNGQPFNFSFQDNVHSEHWRSIIAIHNYPGILKNLGYSLIKLESIKTNNPHPDFRLMSFIAKRDQ